MLRSIYILTALSVLLIACGNNENTASPSTGQPADSVARQTTTSPDPLENLSFPDSNAQSLVALEKQHAQVPSDLALAYELAYSYAEQKNARAVKLADSLIRVQAPEIEKAYYIKATYYAGVKNIKEALMNYDATVGANYHFLDAYFDKGRLLFDQKQYKEALKSFALGQKMSPGTAEFYFWVAKCLEALGEKADAIMNYERAFTLDKSLTSAKEAAERLTQ